LFIKKWITGANQTLQKFGNGVSGNIYLIYNCTIFGNKMNARGGRSPSKDGSHSGKHQKLGIHRRKLV
jgi:hypothetical protein